MTKPSPVARRPMPPAARAPFRFDLRVGAVVIALATLVFFHEVALEGMTFVSPDATAPAGFVKVGEASLKEGVYPLWNPYVFLGMPSFASGGYNPYIYPPDWPVALLQRVLPLPDLTWMLLYYFLGGLFLALLAREWGARPEAATIGGVLFALTPNLVAVGSHGHGSQLVGSAYVPLLLWLASRWMRRGGLQHLGWLALAGGFQMLRGHAQVVFYAWMAVGLWLVIEILASFRRGPGTGDAGATDGPRVPQALLRALGVLVAMSLAFGLAGFYNLPLRDYAQYSIRGGGADGGVGMDYATAWSMSVRELSTLVLPSAVGFGGATYWGAMPFTDYPNAYVGIVALLLAVPAFFMGGAPRVFAILLALFSLVVAMGHHTPLYGLLYDHLPLFNKFRVPVMIVLLTHAAVALGVAWGWTRVLEARETATPKSAGGPLDRVLLGLAVVMALVLAAGTLGGEAWRAGYVSAAGSARAATGHPIATDLANAAYDIFRGDLVRAGVLGLLTVLTALAVLRRRLPAMLGSIAVLVLLAVDLWPVSRALMMPVLGMPAMANVEAGRDDVVDWLQQNGPKEPYRLFPITEFQTNRFAGFGIASLGGYHAAKPRLYQDLFNKKAFVGLWWQRLLNVRYVLADMPLDFPGMRSAFRSPNGFLYENTNALPRATIVGEFRIAASDSAIVDSIYLGAADPARVTWLQRDPGLSLGPVDSATVTIARYSLHEVVLEVNTPGPGLVRLADLWYPDWIATVDGSPVEILRADYALRAVPVPAGKHQVVFQFQSKAVREGMTLTFVSFTGILLLWLAGLLQKRRLRPTGAVAPAPPGRGAA